MKIIDIKVGGVVPPTMNYLILPQFNYPSTMDYAAQAAMLQCLGHKATLLKEDNHTRLASSIGPYFLSFSFTCEQRQKVRKGSMTCAVPEATEWRKRSFGCSQRLSKRRFGGFSSTCACMKITWFPFFAFLTS